MKMEDNNHSSNFVDEYSTSKHPYIPNCVLLEIVYCLPPKSLFQFKCVSKLWNSQINDHSFIKLYLSRHKEYSSPWTLLLRFERRTIGCGTNDDDDNNNEEVRPPFVTSNHSSFNSLRDFFPIPSKKQTFTCLASSGHLLLFQSMPGTCLSFNFVVCNPFVKQSIQLPPIPPSYPGCRIRSQNDVGFISHVHNGVTHYKVVAIICDPDTESILPVAIFSSVTGKWEISRVSLPKPDRHQNLITSNPRYWKVVTCNGIIHWTKPRFSGILAYDANNRTEHFHFIRVPSGPNKGMTVQLLEEWQGRLRYFEVSDVEPPEAQMLVNWRVWVLKDYKKRVWSLEHWNFDKMDIGHIYACANLHWWWFCRRLVPVAFHPLDRNIMYFQCRGKILQYNLSTKLFEEPFNGIIDEAARGPVRCSVFSILLPPCPTAPIAQPRWRTDQDEYTTPRVGGKQKKKGTIMDKILKFFKPSGDT